jgi:hypothetical protein
VLRLRGRQVRGTGAAAVRGTARPERPVTPRWPVRIALGLALAGAVGLATLGMRRSRPEPRHADAPHARPAATEPSPTAQTMRPKPAAGDVQSELRTLIEGLTREERVSTAQALLRHVPIEEVPTYARAMARMQLAETCPQKKTELELFKTLGDPRSLPALISLSQRKRGGCGHRGHEDCLGCLRAELARVIHQLEAKQAQKHIGPTASVAPAN